MIEKMTWDDVYKLWKDGDYGLHDSIFVPIEAEKVFVKYDRDEYIYGYDWLSNSAAEDRMHMIKKNPLQFLLFTQPSNKGTIQTATMLAEAKDEEERAAIWIAATAFELMQYKVPNGVARYADILYYAALEFLIDRYYIWHHAMKRLVPEILIPHEIIKNLNCKNTETVMGLIKMNTVLVKATHSVLLYSSLEDEDEEGAKNCSYRRNEF